MQRVVSLTTLNFNDPKQGSTDRQVRGPTGTTWSEIFRILLVLVRSQVLEFFSMLVRDFLNFLSLNRFWSVDP